MRLDKYLKTARIIKRRTIAKEACDQGKVTINGKVAKAGDNVSVGDKLTLSFGSGQMNIEVLQTKENVRKDEAHELYKSLD
ncbi:RNA-binding S4 domain-containing protein [Gudongella sp. SC589]|jgi:ribosomal 50S subunit-recycling heat shock protein|uniref:RNA-binding S4 domain-containing protein n=1 Tax=Gudongella sp. SC589 TaxID=3385990 RepID=UPI003904D288